MNNLNDAYAFTVKIPALKAVFDPSDEAFLKSLLTANVGTKEGVSFYRCWFSAAQYLELSPAIHRVKKHNRTELGDYTSVVRSLYVMQASQDELEGLELPPGSKSELVLAGAVAYRPKVEFYG